MVDVFKGYNDAPHAPARNFFDIDAVKSDVADLPFVPKGIVCSVAGTVKMTGANGTAVTVTLLANVVYPYAPQQVWSTGTTATGIIGLH